MISIFQRISIYPQNIFKKIVKKLHALFLNFLNFFLIITEYS